MQGDALEDVVVTAPREGVAVVELHGDHDRLTARELEDLLTELTLENRLVVVDVTDANFIDSSFLHNLLKAHSRATEAQHRLVLQLGTTPGVKRALEVSGVFRVIECATSREEAIGDAT